mmetsp:Transcript_7828/g.19156  ORF Transcript_7828/g.19156 Transcript_7828/m.19156 type:complete len:203 (+) Transcript_7828:278-886(+)
MIPFLPNMYGSMPWVTRAPRHARFLPRRLHLSRLFPSGTLMALRRTRLPETTRKLFYVLAVSSKILSDLVTMVSTMFSSCAIATHRTAKQFPRTTVPRLWNLLTPGKTKRSGSGSNRNLRCSTWTSVPLSAGQKAACPIALKDLTIVVLDPKITSDVTLRNPCTGLVSTQASTFRERMEKSCPDNRNTRLDPAWELTQGISS